MGTTAGEAVPEDERQKIGAKELVRVAERADHRAGEQRDTHREGRLGEAADGLRQGRIVLELHAQCSFRGPDGVKQGLAISER